MVNVEHFVTATHLWCWLYDDYKDFFAKENRSERAMKGHNLLDLIYYALILFLIIYFLYFLFKRDTVSRHRQSRYNHWSTYLIPLVYHVFLSIYIRFRIQHEVNLSPQFRYVVYYWVKYFVRAFVCTFLATEFILFVRYAFSKIVHRYFEKLIYVILHFAFIFSIRFVFHGQVLIDRQSQGE